MSRRLNSDDTVAEASDDGSVAALLDPNPATVPDADEWSGPRCEKCEAPIKSDAVNICRRCGWYSSLGTFVELDPNWETSEDESADAAPHAVGKSHLRVWLDLMPRWSWLMIASILAVVVESVVVRLVTPAGAGFRTTWSVGQLTVGAIAVAVCHVLSFLALAAEDANVGVMDIFLRPLKLWIRAIRNLPHRFWVVNSAACGLTAIAMSLLVIGGLPYEHLWDWGVQAPVKQNLMGAVMDRAKQLDSRSGAGSLEEAISDFAGSQDLEGGDGAEKPPKPRERCDCVILGYRVDLEGRLTTLLLGAEHRGALVEAGRVAPEMPEEQRAALLESLKSIKRRDPFIPIQADATWVEPRLTCRVMFAERLKGGRLREVQWETLLGAMDVR